MDGILIIDKPVGLTSHDVVSRLRRILRIKKIGHTGTLDPFATGVLVMLTGKATRLAQFLDKDEKSYIATVRFGFETDTGDRTGESRVADSKLQVPTIEELTRVLPEFIGEIEQIPPMYSAKKVKGKKLYELARKGLEIERKPVALNITELTLTDCKQGFTEDKETRDFELSVTSSAGTYIRTLAEDIGRKAGFPCHLAELRRTKAGRFGIFQAVSLEKLEEVIEANELGRILIPMNEAVTHLPEVVLDEREIEQTKNGMRYSFKEVEVTENQPFRMVSEKQQLVAIGYVNKKEKFIQPRIVMV